MVGRGSQDVDDISILRPACWCGCATSWPPHARPHGPGLRTLKAATLSGATQRALIFVLTETGRNAFWVG